MTVTTDDVTPRHEPGVNTIRVEFEPIGFFEPARVPEEMSTTRLLERVGQRRGRAGTQALDEMADLRILHSRGVWIDDDCRDMAQWISINFGISTYRARRLFACALAIVELPLTQAALADGVLSLDKVVELTRFATPETERKLITWAKRVSMRAIANRADEECRTDIEEAKDSRNDRYLQHWIDGDAIAGCFRAPLDWAPMFARLDERGLQLAPCPSDERPGDEHNPIEQRRIDALYELVMGAAGGVGTGTRTEFFVHTTLHESGFGNGVNGKGTILPPETVERLVCNGRLRFVLTDEDGNATGIGRRSRVVPEWVRQAVMKFYDFTCVFPNCDCRLYLDVHHVVHWSKGGPTDYENLIPLCPRHHTLVHEHGWNVYRGERGTVTWYRPNGRRYEPGPAALSGGSSGDPPGDPPRLTPPGPPRVPPPSLN